MAFIPIIPDGMHLGTSRLVDGAVVGHLFDDESNELRGHAAWQWNDDSHGADEAPPYRSPDELTPEEREAAIQLVAMIVIMVARAASPHVKRWWSAIALPALRTSWQRLRALRSAGNPRSAGSHERPETAAPANADTALVDLLSTLNVTMNRDEWIRGYQRILASGAVTREQLSIFRAAGTEEIGSDPNAPLTETQFADQLQLVLQANPAVLTFDTTRKLERALPLELEA
ncbi:hypothetical protein [Rathayibacter sp. AY1A7]|uniref:hypothetical protein n=1 Tax=Rathayibacter sp. AY1A7 TaxID=2080524 RepID=UPI000CE832AB|nr:hypothetical protein [Rathayibacter sp. AY1A7]PPF20852.1 hypothetical protein C5B95_07255 [Rathayibacter sp. AY1A7]